MKHSVHVHIGNDFEMKCFAVLIYSIEYLQSITRSKLQHQYQMPTLLFYFCRQTGTQWRITLLTFVGWQITKLFLNSLNLTHVSFSMHYTHHPLQQIIAGIKWERSCASIHYMIFAYCVTLHYFQISFKIKICKLVSTSCLTQSKPAMVISAPIFFSFMGEL